MVAIWALPSVVQEGNPWLLLALVLLLAPLLSTRMFPKSVRFWQRGYRDRTLKHWSYVAAALVGGVGLGLETYYAHWCPLDEVLQEETFRALRVNMEVLDRTRFPYWADFGTLLAVLRGIRGMVWDMDSDFSIEAPHNLADLEKIPTAFETLLSEPAGEEFRDCTLEWLAERWIYQVHCGTEAHSDIWVWQRAGSLLTHTDFTNKSPHRDLSSSYPLRCGPWPAVGPDANVCTPRDPHVIAAAEFGSSYMTPIVKRVQCLENMAMRRAPTRYYLLHLALALAAALLVDYLLMQRGQGQRRGKPPMELV